MDGDVDVDRLGFVCCYNQKSKGNNQISWTVVRRRVDWP
jgi:hypothetical protein